MKKKKLITILVIILVPTVLFLLYFFTRPILIYDKFENLIEVEIALQIDRKHYEKYTLTSEEDLRFFYDNIYALSRKITSGINRRPAHEVSWQKDVYIDIRLIYNDTEQKILISYDKRAIFFLQTRGSMGDPGFAFIRNDRILNEIILYIEEFFGYRDERFHQQNNK